MSSGSKKQYVYLDFDGAETFYKGELLNIEQISVAPSGFSEEKIAQIVAALNEKYNGEVIFTAQKPVSEEYSTVFVGQTDAFAEYGDFAGIAETIDRGNQNKSDNAFVMVDAAAAVESVVDVISHEVGHIVYGTEHTEQTNTLADFAAAVLNQPVNMTIGGIDPDEYENNWDDLPGAAKVEPIYGSTVNDVITFAADKSRMISGNIELGSGNDKIVLQASKQNWDDDAETSFTNIFMGSGNDIIEGQANTELDGVKIDMGSGDDTITLNGGDLDVKIVDMGEGDNTIIVKNDSHFETALLKFGSGNDTLKIEGPYAEVDMDVALKNDEEYYYGEVSFGGGDDTLSISAGGYFSAIHTIDFGDGDDTLELNGGMKFDYFWAWGNEEAKETSISISGLEKIVAGDSAWITIYKDDEAEEWSLEQETLNRFIDAGVAVYNSFGTDKFSGPEAELADNTRAGADEYDETCFWLCGESLAADTEYGFADTVDWIKLNKYGETVIAFEYFESENNVIAQLYDANGNYLETLNSERYVKNDITDRANGIYYLKLTVADGDFTCGEVLYDTEDVPPVDLTVKNLKVGSSTIASNSSVKLTFTVTNNGDSAAGPSKIKIYDGSELIKTITVSSLGANTSKTFTETVKGSELGIGKRTLYVEVDADDQLVETNESNNKVSGSVTVKKIADLVVKDCKLSYSSCSYNGGTTLSFKIANDGEYSAGASKVKIYDGDKLLATRSVSSLSAKSSQSFSVSLKGSTLGLGTSTLYVVADADNQVSEYSNSNNKVSKTVTVKKNADLVVKDCTISSSFAYYGSATLSFKIANDGEYSAGASTVKIYDGDRVIKTLSVSSLSAKSSQSCSVTLKGSNLGLGKNTLYVVADANKKVSEYSESNNKVSKTVTVKKDADLVVKNCTVSYSTFSYNGSTTLKFKIANDGEYTAKASKVKIYDGSRVIKTLSVDSIAAKSSRSYSVTIKGSTLGLGKNTLYVAADADGQVSEYSNSNNKVSKSVTVKKNADLTIKNCKVSYSSFSSSSSTKLSFTVANDGEYSIGSTKVKIYDGSKLIKTVSVSSISAKSSRSYSVTLKGSTLGLGKSTIYVEADGEKKYTEYSESNNRASKTVTVKKIADLAVKDCKLSYSTCSYKGSTTLSFKIANEGEYTAGASKVKIYDGSKLLKTLSLSSFSAKSSRSYSVTLKGSTLGLGTSTIYVVADAENKVSEYSSSNNKVSKTVTVKKNADLVVKDCKVNYSTISTCGSVTLSFKIANDGEYSAGASTVKIYDGSRVIKTLSVDSISAKSSRSYSVSFKGSTLGTGKNTLYVAADAGSKISEYSESNNKVSKTVTVTKSTDLCVKDLKVSSPTISADGSVKLTFKIANVGEYGAGSSKVKIYDGDTLLKTLSVNSLSIGKSQSFTVTLSAGELAGLGERKLCVEADGNKQFAELSESNNTSFCTVDITGGTPDWLSAGFGDYGEADGFEDMLVSSKDLNLSADLGSDDEYISGLAAALGEDWTFAGVADWNGDGSLEVLFCGSELSQRPEVDEENKLLITLA